MIGMHQLAVAAVLAFVAGGCFIGARSMNGRGPEAGFQGLLLTAVGGVLLLVALVLGLIALF